MLNKISFFSRKVFFQAKKQMFQLESKLISFENYIAQNRIAYHLLFAIVLCLIFSLILFLNIKTPLIGDDFVYSFVYQTQYRLNSISDIFESQYLHYYKWGGRSVVHFITQTLLLSNNPLLIDCVNSIGFIAFILAVHYHMTGKLKNRISILILSFSLIWLIQPVFAETVLWLTGSCNYLWGTLIILLFLLPYRLYTSNTLSISKDILFSFAMFIGGIIAGWTNENTAAAMIIMIIGFILYYKYDNRIIQLWMYIGLLGALIGYTIMIAAPGNFARAEGTSITPFLVTYRILNYTQNFVNYLGILNLGIALLIIFYAKTTQNNRRATISYLLIYFIGLFISIYIMVASPGFPARAWFGSITFNIIALGILYNKFDPSLPIVRQAKYCFLIFCVVSVSSSFYGAYKEVKAINSIWEERMIIIAEKKNEGAKNVVFKEYQARTKFGLGDAPYALPYMSLYYGIDFQLEK